MYNRGYITSSGKLQKHSNDSLAKTIKEWESLDCVEILLSHLEAIAINYLWVKQFCINLAKSYSPFKVRTGETDPFYYKTGTRLLLLSFYKTVYKLAS